MPGLIQSFSLRFSRRFSNALGRSVVTPLTIAPNAIAAYSLRNLTTESDPAVVRVRRESDHKERDFTESSITSGELTSFVNANIYDTATLDIRGLNSEDEREGNLITPKVAYSLRSLGTNQATVAATGDTVARADGKYVCQVRRHLDDNLKSFTADQITNGALVSYVRDINGVFQNSFISPATGFDTFNNATTGGFEAVNSSPPGLALSSIPPGGVGDPVVVQFTLNYTSGSCKLTLRNSSTLGVSSLSTTFTSSGTYTATLTPNAVYDSVGFRDGTSSCNWSIANFKVLNGASVSKWYDQSGNGIHATQTTAANQPEIVSANSLITGGGMLFSGAQKLSFNPDAFSSVDELSIFSLVNFNNVESTIVGSDGGDASFGTVDASSYHFDNNATQEEGDISTTINTNDDFLMGLSFGQEGSDPVVVSYTNGIAGESIETSAGNFEADAIGNSGAHGAFQGRIKELIIYDSLLQNDRTAIQGSIAEQYNIDLPAGVDTENNQVNGFVSVWYNQAGNDKNLTQITASKQPSIVTDGVLNTRTGSATAKPIIKFLQNNSTNLVAASNIFPSSTIVEITVFHAMHIDVSGGNRAGLFGHNGGGNNPGTSKYLTGTGSARRSILKVKDASNTTTTLQSSSIGSNNTDSILTYINTIIGGTATHTTYHLGDEVTSVSQSVTNQFYTSGNTTILGARSVNDNYSDSEFFEVIVYDSDESAKREAIEINMSTTYGIDLI